VVVGSRFIFCCSRHDSFRVFVFFFFFFFFSIENQIDLTAYGIRWHP